MSVQDRNDQAVSVLGADFPYPAMLLLAHLEAGAGGAASFDFQNIPATFWKLIIELYARGDTAATSFNTLLTVNGLGGVIYFDVRAAIKHSASLGTSEAVGSSSLVAATLAAANSTANYFDQATIVIPAYANTNMYKTVHSTNTLLVANTTTNMRTDSMAGWIATTAAINQLTLTPSAGKFAQYSAARLYGVN